MMIDLRKQKYIVPTPRRHTAYMIPEEVSFDAVKIAEPVTVYDLAKEKDMEVTISNMHPSGTQSLVFMRKGYVSRHSVDCYHVDIRWLLEIIKSADQELTESENREQYDLGYYCEECNDYHPYENYEEFLRKKYAM